MPNPVIGQLVEQVAQNTTITGSAIALINGFAGQLKAAVDAAIENGATAAELAPVQDVIVQLESNRSSLAAAVAANTPQQA